MDTTQQRINEIEQLLKDLTQETETLKAQFSTSPTHNISQSQALQPLLETKSQEKNGTKTKRKRKRKRKRNKNKSEAKKKEVEILPKIKLSQYQQYCQNMNRFKPVKVVKEKKDWDICWDYLSPKGCTRHKCGWKHIDVNIKKQKQIANNHRKYTENWRNVNPINDSDEKCVYEFLQFADNLSDLQKYIEHLLYFELNHANKELILKKMRKLAWNDTDTTQFIIDKLFNISMVAFNKIDCIAAIISGLNGYHSISTIIVDYVCEEIRIGLEEEDFTQQQRRLAYVKFLAELYVYKVVNAQVILDTLHLFIMFDCSDESEESDESDADVCNFRIILSCMLLKVCGEYFKTNKLKLKCDRFLLSFERFILSRITTIPCDVEWWIYDALRFIAPDIMRTYSESSDALLVSHDKIFIDEYDKIMEECANISDLKDESTFKLLPKKSVNSGILKIPKRIMGLVQLKERKTTDKIKGLTLQYTDNEDDNQLYEFDWI